jgi:dTDP-4-amino-4,6-dideoxygalactose transaminase
VTNNTRAILLVHLYGRAADMGQWQKLAREKKLLLLEDCAQSHGASWNGTNVGNFGIFAAWSFYPTKNLGALGDGGAITTGDAHLAEKIKQLRNYGQSKRYHHPLVGLNSRLDEIQAAILSERLKWLDRFTERRREIANAYRDGIDNPEITLLAPPRDPNGHVHHLFVIKTKRREAFISHLESKGVASLIHYPVPVHNQEPCVNLRLDPKGLSNCEAFSKECVSLPIHPQLSDEDVSIVISAVNSFC